MNKWIAVAWGLGGAVVVGVYAGAVSFAKWERAKAPGLPEPVISKTRPGNGRTGVLPNCFIAADVYLPNVGMGVDATTMTTGPDGFVHLYKMTPVGRTEVPGLANTSGGGDSIIFQPNDSLDVGTTYQFVCQGVRDRSGALFHPYSMSFKTADAGVLCDYPVRFEKVMLPGTVEAAGTTYTGLTLGPDHRLYAGTFDGIIARFDLMPDGTLSAPTLINTIVGHNKTAQNPDGHRLVTGIGFDPRSTPENPIVWVTNGQWGVDNVADWTTKLTRLTGPNLDQFQDAVVGLPRAWRDHLAFKIAFNPKDPGGLYFDQGSSSSTGDADTKWGLRAEHLLTAACLRVDVAAVEARLVAGQGPLDVKTEDDGHYDPFAANAPVTLYATGMRCGFGLLFHSNGRLYSCLNGGAAGGAAPGTPDNLSEVPRRTDAPYAGGIVPPIFNVDATQPDLFVGVEKGGFYGHPNSTRGEYVLFGGNPDGGVGHYQVHGYPKGVLPDRNYRPALWNLGDSRSCNGLVEYKSDAFGSALKGKILTTRYSGGKDILVISLNPDGTVAETFEGINGLTQFIDPLDLAEDPATGNVYVSEYGGHRLTLLRPVRGGVSHAVVRDDKDQPSSD